MSINGQGRKMVCLFENSRSAFHVMKVAIDDRRNGCIGYFTQTAQRFLHLFFRLPGINRNDTIGRKDEGLVRQAVAHQAPHAFAHFVEAGLHHSTLGEVVAMHTLPTWGDDNVAVMSIETTSN